MLTVQKTGYNDKYIELYLITLLWGSIMFEAVRTAAQAVIEGLKIAPAIGVLCWNAFVSAVPALTMILALLYLVLQISYLVWKWKKEHKDADKS